MWVSESRVRGFMHEDIELPSIMWVGEIPLYIIIKYSNSKYRTSCLLPKWGYCCGFPPSFMSFEGLAWLPSFVAALCYRVSISTPVLESPPLRGILFSQFICMSIKNNGLNCWAVNLY